MEFKPSSSAILQDGFETLAAYSRQAVQGNDLDGKTPAEYRVSSIREIIQKSGMSLEQARGVIEESEGLHKEESLEALGILEKEEKIRKK